MAILLVGCGQLGMQLGTALSAAGQSVVGIKRTPISSPFKMIYADLQRPTAFDALDVTDGVTDGATGGVTGDTAMQATGDTTIEAIVFTVTPSEYSDAGYQAVYETMLQHTVTFAQQCATRQSVRQSAAPLFVLVSSTRVYGQDNGEWVDEASPTSAHDYRSKWLLFGEDLVQSALPNSVIVRFSGIYGNARNRMLKNVARGTPVQRTPPYWTNRIHENDCVAALVLLLSRARQGHTLDSVYLASDDCPAPLHEVYDYIANRLAVKESPVGLSAAAAEMLPEKSAIATTKQAIITAQAINTMQGKRCCNARLRALGLELMFPSYREGYATGLES